MRDLQKFIRVFGALAWGSVWGCCAVGLLWWVLIESRHPGSMQGLGAAFTGIVCGLPLGLIVGVPGAMKVARSDCEDWSRIVWIGVALASAPQIVVFVDEMDRSPRMERNGLAADPHLSLALFSVSIGVIMYGCLGGMLGEAGEGIWRLTRTSRSSVVTTGIRLFFALLPTVLMQVLITLAILGQLSPFKLLVIGVPIVYVLPMVFGCDDRRYSGVTVKSAMRAKASVRTKIDDEPDLEKLAAAAVAGVRALIEKGDSAGARAAYDKATRTLASWPSRSDLRALIKAFHAQGARADSLPLMRDHCRYHPAESSHMMLKLAQVLIRDCRRPAAALKVLDEIPADALPANLEIARQKLRRQAARMCQEGVVELEGDD